MKKIKVFKFPKSSKYHKKIYSIHLLEFENSRIPIRTTADECHFFNEEDEKWELLFKIN